MGLEAACDRRFEVWFLGDGRRGTDLVAFDGGSRVMGNTDKIK